MEKMVLDEVLHAMLTAGKDISDLNLTVNKPLQVEIDGSLTKVKMPIELALGYLSPFQTEQLSLLLAGDDPRSLNDLITHGSCDLGYSLRKEARFRVNVFNGKSNYSIVLRRLQTIIPSFNDIKAPDVFKKTITEKNGLILVTGATGSGKSTTLAAMLRALNEKSAMHIVTLEDPIEFVHESINATFNQRELGTDFDSFPNGLRAALRQAPKVILVGEMRDRDTMEIGITAAETGHLVLSTLHTVDAGQTINRIIGMFEKDQEEQIRMRLADTLRWVICQRLIRKIGGGRVAVHEIMGMNLRVRDLILHGEDEIKTYSGIIEDSEAMGWKSFENSLIRLYKTGTITEDEAMQNSTRKNLIRQRIDILKNQRGEVTTDLEGLQVDKNYAKKALTEAS